MAHYQIEYSKKEKGWVPKKQGSDYKYRRALKSPSFPTPEEAEEWIREVDTTDPWIDHKIQGYFGHLMLLKEWEEDCDHGVFIDYDGYGDLVDSHYNIITEFQSVCPSDYTDRKIQYPPEAKYILWYNR